MHSHQRSRVKVLFEVLCALSLAASFAGAWQQTGSSALLASASIMALFAVYWSFGLVARDRRDEAAQPAAAVADAREAAVETAHCRRVIIREPEVVTEPEPVAANPSRQNPRSDAPGKRQRRQRSPRVRTGGHRTAGFQRTAARAIVRRPAPRSAAAPRVSAARRAETALFRRPKELRHSRAGQVQLAEIDLERAVLDLVDHVDEIVVEQDFAGEGRSGRRRSAWPASCRAR